jgi:anti-anti-sigma factor
LWVDEQVDLVVECSGVTFMDSMGITVLFYMMRGATEAGHGFALAAPSQAVTSVLRLAGIGGLFKQIPAAA